MKIKRYIGNTTQEAMRKVKSDLGSDAVILHKRKIKRRGFFNLFKKSLIEIVVAIDENEDLEKKVISNKNNETKFEKVYKPIQQNKNDKYQMNSEIRDLRNSIDDMMKYITKDERKSSLPEPLKTYHNSMIEKGVNEKVAYNILRDVNSRINIQSKNEEAIRKVVECELKEYLGKPKPIELNGNTKTIFFVGPTGVGKTTTIAKIAAQYAFQHKKDVGIISADTYRIAAVEQIKTYCEIMKLPLKIIYQQEDIYESLASYKYKDVVFVDTAGRSHKDIKQLNEVMNIIEEVNNKEIFLVISSTTDFSTIRSIITTYKKFGDYKIIFTKLDESENPGVILNTKYWTENPLSYITTGQNVPEDIQIADVTTLINTMIGGQP